MEEVKAGVYKGIDGKRYRTVASVWDPQRQIDLVQYYCIDNLFGPNQLEYLVAEPTWFLSFVMVHGEGRVQRHQWVAR